MLLAAVAGFADAAYLTAEHYRGIIPPCTVGQCETVLTSHYAVVAGIPIAVAGVAYYGLVVLLLIAYLDGGTLRTLRATARLTGLGFLASLGFVGLQLFVIHAICQYCMFSALMCLVLVCCGVAILRHPQEVVS